jgi:signal transduction histidine kinase
MELYFQLSYIIVSFITFAAAAGFYFKRPDSAVVRTFSALLATISAWIGSLYIFYVINDPAIVIMIGRLNFAFTELMATAAFFFAYRFPQVSYTIKRGWQALVLFETTLLMVVTAATSLVDENEIIKGIGRVTEFGPLYFWFVAHFVVLAAIAFFLIISKCRALSGPLKEQSMMVALGWGVGCFIGVITNIVLPITTGWFDAQYFGILAAVVFVCSTGYATARSELFNLKVILTELIAALFVLVTLIAVVLSVDREVRYFLAGAAVLSVISGVTLIRSVRREVARAEQADRLNRELAIANSQLQEMDHMKSEFIVMASHQLRTPISVVKGYLSLMMEGAYGVVPASIKDKLAQMFSLNESLVQMIDNMLNVARIEKRNIDYNVERVDILPIVRGVVEDMRVKLGGRNITIGVSMPELPVMAYVDEEKYEEVLTNLVDNAIKYTDKGEIDVRVRDDDGNGFVAVSVRDSGMGMSPEEASRVFTKFFRAKEAVIREPGTGLGLYICGKFMNGMGGQISVVETAPGYGTTFETRLPTRQRDPGMPLT